MYVVYKADWLAGWPQKRMKGERASVMKKNTGVAGECTCMNDVSETFILFEADKPVVLWLKNFIIFFSLV